MLLLYALPVCFSSQKSGLYFAEVFACYFMYLRFFCCAFCSFSSLSSWFGCILSFLSCWFCCWFFVGFFKITLLIRCLNGHTFEYLNEIVPGNTKKNVLYCLISADSAVRVLFFFFFLDSRWAFFVPYLSEIGLLRGFGKNPSLQVCFSSADSE